MDGGNSEAIFSTRPWIVYGEGHPPWKYPRRVTSAVATDVPLNLTRPRYSIHRDRRMHFTAIVMEVAAEKTVLIKSLRTGGRIASVLHVSGGLLALVTPKNAHVSQDEGRTPRAVTRQSPSENAFALKIAGVTARIDSHYTTVDGPVRDEANSTGRKSDF